MGKIHLPEGFYTINHAYHWRCLVCDDLILNENLLHHLRTCSSLRIKSQFFNKHAIRYHLLLHLLGLQDGELDKNINLMNFKEFILAIYSFIYNYRLEFPLDPEMPKIFFQQELYIMRIVIFSLFYYNVPIIREFRQLLIEKDYELDIFNSNESL
jgi:hypothetical protein